ncbi:MAG TPA: GGDEF domain-containing protein [Magnetospirillaceae bacterium]|nr:GGDEF domain-containing protein [Magnetospirillaceae bacterium]
MKTVLKITAIHLACSAAAFLLSERMLEAGVLRDAAVLAVSGFVLFGLVSLEFKRRDRTEQALRVQATHDSLTGLVNRAHFEESLQRASARAARGGHHFGVAYIDLNDFKQVNDRHGHHVGDLLLQDVARRISSVVRAGDCAARFGGDEFVILVDDRKESSAYRLAERLREVFAIPFEAGSLNLAVTASIGVAFYPEHGRQGVNLLQAADKAMYVAKRGRRGRAVTAFSSAA